MVKIIQGNLVKQNTEGIINPIHADIIFDRGIPFFIKKNGGDPIEKEALRYYPSKLGAVFNTQGGDLPAKKVIHLVNREFSKRTSYRSLEHALTHALLMAFKLHLKSLSIPPIYNRFSPQITAHILCDGIKKAVSQQPELKDMQMNVVIFDREASDIFYQVFKEEMPELIQR
jgi:O-acetyl-ADP-ribose deacetylase (regulator of RNase III)